MQGQRVSDESSLSNHTYRMFKEIRYSDYQLAQFNINALGLAYTQYSGTTCSCNHSIPDDETGVKNHGNGAHLSAGYHIFLGIFLGIREIFFPVIEGAITSTK